MPHGPAEKDADHFLPRVLVFFDYACQFCYLDWPRFKRLREEHGVEIFLVPYELRPTLPAEGAPVDDLGGEYSENVKTHMNRLATEGRLHLIFPDFVPNTHHAFALGEFARDLGLETHEAVHEALFEAYSGHGRDLGKVDVLLDVAESQGLDRDEVRSALEEGRLDDRLKQFHHLALSMGITATPAALICNELFIGTRPYRLLEESLQRCIVTQDKILVGSQVDRQAQGVATGGPGGEAQPVSSRR